MRQAVDAGSWLVVMPVKPLAMAKRRLLGALPAVAHEDLALALILDTVAAALRCLTVDGVVVVTDDEQVGELAGRLGAQIAPDTPNAGLNSAVAHGARLADGRPVAALTADLPALRAEELAAALAAAAGATRAFVADHAGTGTTMLTAQRGVALRPKFGPASAAAHAQSGATRLAGAWPTLRRDVDTSSDLQTAAVLGVGERTSALLIQ